MHPEEGLCEARKISKRAEESGCVANAPFGDHKGPIVQFGGAFFGHWPPISLRKI
jgi:hypothetical protein